jgi:hypothetical protein
VAAGLANARACARAAFGSQATELLCNVSEEDFIAYHTWSGENLRQVCREQSKKTGKKISTFNLILDMDGLSLAHRNALSFLKVQWTPAPGGRFSPHHRALPHTPCVPSVDAGVDRVR